VENVKKLYQAGASNVIRPFEIAGMVVAEYVGQPVAFEAILGIINADSDIVMETINVPLGSDLEGKEISTVDFLQRKLILFGVISANPEHRIHKNSYQIKSQHFYFNPPAHFLLRAGDLLVVLGRIMSIEHFNSQIEKSGIFNAGFIGFRNDKNGVSVLNWWLNKCTSSCSSIVTSDVYGDQLYLNQIPILYKGIFECKHLGINAAPWNITDKLITKSNSSFFVNNDELLHYHFQGFEFINQFLFDIYKGNFKINRNIKTTIYKYYLKLFQNILKNKVHNIAKLNISDTNVNFKLFIIKFLKMLKGFNNIIIYYD
jgi:hypothetical protein